ncbi:MAG: MG2 domain-containing protein, partial [Bacteroidales bacterium]|nr:MG2 domain-containing protein [Bacteroidales bacterium]
QVLGTAKTDKNGFALVTTKNKPFVVTALAGKESAYLRLVDGEENTLNRFDIGGSKINKGLKGFIYGERGVWRPGDTLFLSFMLKDPEKKIPSNHPVILELYNPRGQFVYKSIKTEGVNGFYTFQIPTAQNDPTGIWNAYVKLGGVSFHKSLRIETIKPNRLKINLTVPGKKLIATKDSVPLRIQAAWLTGLKAGNLKTKVEMTLSNRKTTFKGFENFVFANPAAGFQTHTFVAYEGVLDAEGKTSFNLQTPVSAEMPGMMSAQLLCRVFEPGGDASMYVETLPFSPFSTYVGINFNNDKTFIETDADKIFNVVTLNHEGKLVDNADLEYKIYKVQWNWWWENSNENLSSYINNTNLKPVSSGKLKTVNGKAAIKFRINYPEWGRYLVYVKDKKGQHASGGLVYVDWPEWRGRSTREDPSGVKMLTFSADKTSYENGEMATIILPIAAGGKALVAIENGSQVLHREWIEPASKGDTKYQFKITEEMAPNVYVHITFLQAHAQSINDLPIRMYGVIPVFVNNKQTKLFPELILSSIVRPEQSFSIKVKEKNGRAMTYTLAIVDDGLLDLTNFKTPDPWSEFYAREALGIRTWDMYDDVIGAYSGNYGMLFTIGGDAALKPANAKANRFKPVIRFLGPFVLKKGEVKTHTVKLPPYMGSVRVMLVAGQDAAYGNAEKTILVRSPLMVLSSLPRVVSINEEIEMPVNVFAMEKSVKNVDVKIRTTGKLKVVGNATQSTSFTTTGDKLVYFALKSGGQTGIEKITVTANANGIISSETIELDVRNPNPPILFMENKILDAGEEVALPYALEGNYNGNWLKLEASRIPFVDISRRLDFMYTYSHSCSEQLISTAFPLLYALQLDKNTQDAERIKKHVKESIAQLYARQLTNGGFSIWPGQQQANSWVTSYAGNFLIIAKEKGYEVNQSVINKWIAYQRKAAREWKVATKQGKSYVYYQEDFEQAYRLYTLALANAAEMGAMNRLKEIKDLSIQAKWRLAAAYAISGKTKIGNDIVFNVHKTINPYSSNNTTFGSSDRDEAMILESLILLGKLKDAFQQAQRVSENLRKETIFSTQSTAYALIAMGRFAEKMAGNLQFDWAVNGMSQQAVKTANVMFRQSLKTYPLKGSVHVKNRGTGSVYVSLVSKTVPFVDNRPPINHKLKVVVLYTSLDGKKIDVATLKQGTDFMAVVRIYNTDLTQDYTSLALTHILPSGWEILNERMSQLETGNAFTYQDIRDDRVLTYFDLQRGKSIVVKVRLQASYCGSFLLPAILCEPMYHANAQARTAAGRVMVVK